MIGNGAQGAARAPRPHEVPPDHVIFGSSAAMAVIRQKLTKICATRLPILIQGEAGTGKKVVARWIHSQSPEYAGPFVKVNCAAIPGTLLEGELFGYEKGAFTGANVAKPGRVELAEGGTLFLDEIAELEPSLQAKFLQVLQDGQFSRLGDTEDRRVNARVICASNRRIEDAVQSGKFREDLYYRISVFNIELPRLSARVQDIPSIANHMVEVLNLRFQRRCAPLPPRILLSLQKRHWAGNIRELENLIARYVLLGLEETFKTEAPERWTSRMSSTEVASGSIPLKRISDQARRDLSRELILKVLQENRWNRRKTADVLKISYRTLLYKIREAGLLSKRVRPANDSEGAAVPGLPGD